MGRRGSEKVEIVSKDEMPDKEPDTKAQAVVEENLGEAPEEEKVGSLQLSVYPEARQISVGLSVAIR